MSINRNINRLPDPNKRATSKGVSDEDLYGPAVCASDRPDYFRIRSKLPLLLLGIPAVILFLGFVLTGIVFRSKAFIIVWAAYGVIAVVFNRLNMGVVFDFFPDSVYVPEKKQLSPYSGRYECMGNDPSEQRIRLHNVERIRMHTVERHPIFGLSFLLISLDEKRPGKPWWLYVLLRYRRFLVLMLTNHDADKAFPLLQTYLYY